MWVPTYHRFASRAAFLAACDSAGWPIDAGTPRLPAGVALDEVGMLYGPASIGPGGIPMAGALLDARHHVNAAWHAQDMPEAFAANQVTPTTPARAYALPAPASGEE